MGFFLQDVRYALRLLAKKPSFAAIAMLTISVGIGANTAIFSVVNSFILRPLPFTEPDRLIMVQKNSAVADYGFSVYSYPVFNELREQAQTLDGITAFASGRFTFDGSEGPETVWGNRVTGNFFTVLGVTPILGRGFVAGEDGPNQPQRIVLSYSLWQRRFGGDPHVIGQSIVDGQQTAEIIGVMPEGFKFDLWPEFPKIEFWTSLNPSPGMVTAKNINWLRMIGRLRQGAGVDQSRSELGVIAERIREAASSLAAPNPRLPADFAISAVTVRDFFVGPANQPLLVLFGAVGFVLLIACVNVANLLLAQGVGRQKELAIRSALGASRGRLVRQNLTESLVLSITGGFIGLLLVTWSIKLISSLTPAWMMRMQEISVDLRVLLFAGAVSIVTGVLFGFLPSLFASRPDLQAVLRQSGSRSGARIGGFRSALVIAELAFAVVLLVGAGLMMKSFLRLTSVDLGFVSENILTVRMNMLARQKEPDQIAFAQELLPRVKAMPGVTDAALVGVVPTEPTSSQTNKRRAVVEGPLSGDPDEEVTIRHMPATESYFHLMGIRLIKGRLFGETDTAAAPPVVVVTEQTAREFWPGEDPIGKRLLWSWVDGQRPTVIGIVSDVRVYDSNKDPEPTSFVYSSFYQSPERSAYLAVRTADDPTKLTETIRSQILGLDRRVVVDNISTMDARLGKQVAQPRFYSILLGCFAAIGTLLSILGLYGVISYLVSQRTHEMGIRIALGAQNRDILRLVLGRGLALTVAGLAVGLAGAVALTRLLESVLFEVTPADPVTYAGVSILLLGFAALAYYVPARRATKVDPVIALRNE